MKRVGEFAKAKGISRGRVYQLVHAGDLPSHELADGSIVLDDAAMSWKPRKGRPLSPVMAWALLDTLDGAPPAGLRDAERARVKQHVAAIAESESPAEVLAGKVAARAVLREYAANAGSVHELRNDPRLHLSGVGAPSSGMVAGDVVEAYVDERSVEDLEIDYLLVSRRGGNVRLRVAEVRRVGKAALAADLADWGMARELREANRLMDELLQELR